MSALFGAHRFHLASAVVLLALTPAAFAEVFIRLDGIPDRLSFPYPPGANQLLTATITGGPVESVWLEPDPTQPSEPRVPFARIGPGEYSLNLADAEIYNTFKPFGSSGQFRVCAKLTDGSLERSIPLSYTLRQERPQSDVPDDAKLTIYQRSSRVLSSPDGNVQIHLGDITHGQVIVTVRRGKGELLQGPHSMHVDDSMELTVAGARYQLRLEKLTNLLVGTDFAVFSLMPVQKDNIANVEDLLRVIAQSGATFIRNGQEVSADASAEFLRQKLARSDNPNRGVSEFIDQIATRSSTSGKPYQVKLPDGTVHELGPWLREKISLTAKAPAIVPALHAQAQPALALVEEPNPVANAYKLPHMDRAAFERFLTIVEQSGVIFMSNGADVCTAVDFARLFLEPILKIPSQGDYSHFTVGPVAVTHFFEVRPPDGRRVQAPLWLREQAMAAQKAPTAPK